MMINPLGPKRKIFIFFIIFWLTFSGFLITLGIPRVAQATLPVADAPSLGAYIGMETKAAVTKQVSEVKTTILNRIMKSLTLIGAQALKSLSLKLTQYISSGVMNLMQSGSWGQEAMWETATWEEWGKQLGGTVLSEVMSEISTGGPWANYFDICEPSAELKLNILATLETGALRDSLMTDQMKNSRCSWDRVKNNWEGFIEDQIDYFSGQAELASYVTMNVAIRGFEPQQSEIGQFLWAVDLAKSEAKKLEELKKEQRVEGEGYKPDGENITGTEQQNPPGTAKSIQEENLRKQTNQQQSEQDQALAVLTEIPEQIAVTFLKSVVSQQFVTSLFDLVKKGFSRSPSAYNPSQQVFDYQAQTAGQIAKINEIKVSFNQKEVDFLTDFVNCPNINNNIQQNNINNCVIYKEFADAVREADYGNPLTVQQALETGQIKDLIFIDDTVTSDQVDCLNGAYCYSNLVKLRKARIIPIGWELAAKQVGSAQNVKLSTLLSCFVNPYEAGSADYQMFQNQCVVDDKKYEGLVDPDWVLKQPRATCEAVAFGPTLMANGGTERYEYCADVKTCVDEKEDGSCGHYAYCAAESSTWRLGGTACIGNYDSCRSLTRIDGKKFNYVMNTVDYGACNSENAGCLPYSLWKADPTKPESAWSQEYPANYYKNGNSLVYLNRKIEDSPCSPGDVGCTRLINTFNQYGANLVPNSDFSYEAQGWQAQNGEVSVVTDGTNGQVAQINQAHGFVVMEKNIAIVPKKFERYYMFRAKVNVPAGATLDMIPLVRQMTDTGVEIIAEEVVKMSEDQEILNNPLTRSSLILTANYVAGEWSEVMKIVKLEPSAAYLNVKFTVTGSNQAMFDEVLITEMETPDRGFYYSDYAQKAYEYQKLAPDYLQCYDAENVIGESMVDAVVDGDRKWYTPVTTDSIYDSNLDPAYADSGECSKFAQMCSAEEVGCDRFTPVDRGMSISGVASTADVCPAQCAGYETFSQGKTRFADAKFPLYFIPSTAQKCSATQVGCEEFTNLDSLESGGEGREYYSEVRLCKKTDTPATDPDCGTFYSWVGTNVGGYQLQVYNLQMQGSSPKLTNLYPSNTTCNANNYNPSQFPECRQLIDNSGRIHYVILENTIKCSEDCQAFRRTLTYDNATQCTDRGGEYRGGECVFWLIPDESKTCASANAGCRQYRGNTASDVQLILDDTFDSLNQWTGGIESTQSMVNGGKSLKLLVAGSGADNDTTRELPFLQSANQSYIVGFWAQAISADAEVEITLGNVSTTVEVVAVADSGTVDFRYYTTDILTPTENFRTISIENLDANSDVYFDTIQVKRLNDVQYLITDSWRTPLACDQTLDGQNLPQAQLGCRAFENSKGAVVSLKSLRNTCRSEAVGCQAYIDTKNSASPFSEVYNATTYDVCSLAKENGDLPPGDDCAEDFYDELMTMLDADQKAELQNDYAVCNGEANIVTADSEGNIITEDAVNWCSNLLNLSACISDPLWKDSFLSRFYDIDISDICRANPNLAVCQNQSESLPSVYVDYSPTVECKKTANNKAYCESIDGYAWVNGQCITDDNKFTVSADNLIYLVTNDKTACGANALGCTMIGKPTLDVNYQMSNELEKDGKKVWQNKTFILRPDDIRNKLCLSGEIMCEQYQDNQGNKFYFRNPGDRVCEYITKPGDTAPRWWHRTLDAEGKVVDWTGCQTRQYYNDGNDQLLRSTDVNYHVGANDEYEAGWVGLCNAKNDMCTAFVDPADVSGGSIYGKAYYYLNDDDIKDAPSASPKKGNLLFNDTSKIDAQGNIEYLWNAKLTYSESEARDNQGVAPVAGIEQADNMFNWLNENSVICSEHSNYEVCTKDSLPPEVRPNMPVDNLALCFTMFGSDQSLTARILSYICALAYFDNVLEASDDGVGLNDCTKEKVACYTTMTSPLYNNSNRMISVTRDRTCSQWYECKGGMTVYDPQTNSESFVCLDMGLCDQVREGGSGSTACGHFLLEENNQSLLTQNTQLNVDTYGARPKGWTDFDYSGYSIANMYPLQYYRSVDVGASMKNQPTGEYRLVHSFGPCGIGGTCASGSVCLNNVCVESVVKGQNVDNSSSPECRAYPEADSPFPNYAGSPSNPSYNLYKNVFTCETVGRDTGYDCGCAYEKVTFGKQSLEKFYPALTDSYLDSGKDGFCQDFPDIQCNCATKVDGEQYPPMNTATQCQSYDCQSSNNPSTEEGPGVCLKPDADITRYEGIDGYCLEYDRGGAPILGLQNRRACLTWYPLTNMIGLSNMHEEPKAGYQFFNGGSTSTNFCVAAKGNNQRRGENLEVSGFTDYVKYYTMYMNVGDSDIDYKEKVMTSLYEDTSDDRDIPNNVNSVLLQTQDIYLRDIAAIQIDCMKGEAGDWCKNGNDPWFSVIPFQMNKSETANTARADRYSQALGELGTLEGYNFPPGKEKFKDYKFYEVVYLQGNNNTVMDNYESFAPGASTEAFYSNNLMKIGDKNKSNNGAPIVYNKDDESIKDNFIIFLKDYAENATTCKDIFSSQNYPCAVSGYEAPKTIYQEFLEIEQSLGLKMGGLKNQDESYTLKQCNVDADCGTGFWMGDTYIPNQQGSNICIDNICSNIYCGQVTSGLPNYGCNPVDILDEGAPSWTCNLDLSRCVASGSETLIDDTPLDPVLPGLDPSGLFGGEFKGECNPKEAGASFNNYFGLRFLFDENDKWVGVWYSFCDNSNQEGWQKLRIGIHFTEYCTEVADVVFDGNKDKAKTNTIYQYYKENLTPLNLTGNPVGANPYQLVYNSFYAPMGGSSEKISDNVIAYVPKEFNPKDNNPKEMQPGGSAKNELMINYVSSDNYPGKPLSCPGGKTADGYCNNVSRETGLTTLQKMFAKMNIIWKEPFNKKEIKDISGDIAQVDNPPIVAAAYTPRDNQRSTFIGPIYEAKLNDIAVNYQLGDIKALGTQYLAFINFYAWASDNQMPIAEIALDYGDSAQRFSTGPTWLRNSKVVCQSDPDKPGKVGLCSNAEGIMEDDSFVCSSDNDCDQGQKCEFDRLGICIDGLKLINGFACRTNADCQQGGLSPNVICSINLNNDRTLFDRFGDAPNACRENQPFIFDHVYNCEGYTSVCSTDERAKTYDMIKKAERGETLTMSDYADTCLCEDPVLFASDPNIKDSNCWNLQENACQFKPRVMVKDNWGWCTGSCTTNDLWYLGGCYDGSGTSVPNRCVYDLDSGYNSMHWVKFSGRILLQPK